MTAPRVLVTGGSGFVGAQCLVTLLQAGYQVRTTLRSAHRIDEVRAMVAAGGVDAGDRLSFAVADLTSDDGWAEAVAGCRYVWHVASPFPAADPADESEVIEPARLGTLRVLRAAREAAVQRVVLTSSFAAVGYGHRDVDREFTEDDWADITGPDVTVYIKSKPIAERAAWDFVANGGPELSVVIPTGIFGPLLGHDLSTSIVLIQQLITEGVESLDNIAYAVVDVRDVADAQLRAMTHPDAAGERFIVCCDGGPITMRDAAYMLRRWTGADRVVDAPVVGPVRRPSNVKAKSVLGWRPRETADVLVATAESLTAAGLVAEPGSAARDG